MRRTALGKRGNRSPLPGRLQVNLLEVRPAVGTSAPLRRNHLHSSAHSWYSLTMRRRVRRNSWGKVRAGGVSKRKRKQTTGDTPTSWRGIRLALVCPREEVSVQPRGSKDRLLPLSTTFRGLTDHLPMGTSKSQASLPEKNRKHSKKRSRDLQRGIQVNTKTEAPGDGASERMRNSKAAVPRRAAPQGCRGW